MNKKKTILMLSSLSVLAFGSLLAVGAKAPEGVRASDGNATGTTPVTTLTNGGFETGDLTGWEVVSGDAFTADAIADAQGKYWDVRPFYAEGTKMLSGFKTGENKVGVLKSEQFLVKGDDNGNSYVSFMLGGGAHPESIYVKLLNDEGQEVVRQANVYFSDPALAQGMITYFLNVSDHIGDVLEFWIVDEWTGGNYGALQADNFRVNLSEETVLSDIEDLRAFAETVDDPYQGGVTKTAYVNLYNNLMTYPIAGEAPVVKQVDGYAVVAEIMPGTIDIDLYLGQIEATDDYTLSTNLTRVVTGARKNGSPFTYDDPHAIVLDIGTYEFDVLVGDGFKTSSTIIKITVSSEAQYPSQIVNGGFELGNLTGWEVVSGNVNSNSAVITGADWSMSGSTVPYNKEGTYHFDGWQAWGVEPDGYSLRSTTFTLSGTGFISFRIGGGPAARLHVKSAETGQAIATYTNTSFKDVHFPSIANGCMLATMSKYIVDLSAHLGKNLYIEIEDVANSGAWGVAFFDEITTYYEDVPTFGFDVVSQYANGRTEYAAIPNNYIAGSNATVSAAYTFLEKYFDTFRALGKNFTYCDAQNVYDGTLEGLYQEYLTLGSEAKAIVDATADFNYVGAAITSEITTDCTVGESLANYARIRQTDASGNALFQGAMADDNTLIAILSCSGLAVLGLLAGGIVLCKKKKAN